MAQRGARRCASALSCSAGDEAVQQERVGIADEGSGTEAVTKTSRKRAATSSLLQHTAKRRASD